MNALETKIPPAVVLLVCGFLSWLMSKGVPSLTIELPYRYLAAWVVVATGILVIQIAVVTVRRAKSTLSPRRPEAASALVRSGIYRLTRNPIYLGLAVVLGGWGVLLANGAALLLVPIFVAYLDRFQIRPEERALERLFGEEFNAYRREVRRWI